MIISHWKPLDAGVLRGTFNLMLPSGMLIMGCMLFERDGEEWIGFPTSNQIDRDGRVRVDQNGKRLREKIIVVPDKARKAKFDDAVLSALSEFRQGRAA